MVQSIVKSVQKGTITIAAASNSNTATLSSAVITANAVVIFNGFTSPNSASFDAAFSYPALFLTNSNTVTAQTGAVDSTYARTVAFTVIEFLPGVLKSNIAGSVTLSSGSTSSTANVFNNFSVANSVCLPRGSNYTPSANSGNIYNGIVGQVAIDSPSFISGKTNFLPGGALLTLYFTLLEFQPGILKSVQQVSINILDPAVSATATISSVGTANCWTVFNGWYVDTYAIASDNFQPIVKLTNSTTVTASIIASLGFMPAETTHVAATVVEFNSGILNSRAAGKTQINSGSASATATISAVNTSGSLFNFLNWNDDNAADNGSTNTPYPRGALTNSTTATFTAGAANASSNINVEWEVLEFSSAGNASGVGVASAVGSQTSFPAVGIASGQGSAVGIGAALFKATGTASGQGSANAAGASYLLQPFILPPIEEPVPEIVPIEFPVGL